jgi:hypothetical protein
MPITRKPLALLVLTIVIAMSLSIASASAAESTWDVLERFGLMGVWAISCDRPATAKSFHTIFSKGDGGIALREIDYGAGYPILRTIVEEAHFISPTKLKMRVRNTDPNWGKTHNVAHEAVFVKESDPRTNEVVRIRAIESILDDGTVLVRDGLRPNGKPNYWDYKCRSAMS